MRNGVNLIKMIIMRKMMRILIIMFQSLILFPLIGVK